MKEDAFYELNKLGLVAAKAYPCSPWLKEIYGIHSGKTGKEVGLLHETEIAAFVKGWKAAKKEGA